MNADALVVRPPLDEVRQYFVARLNLALRRPQLFGGEASLMLFMDAVAFIDGLDGVWPQEQDRLEARGALNVIGVRGAFRSALPRHDNDYPVASVYAAIAWRHNWLSIDRALPDRDYQQLRDEISRWSSQDRDLDQILAQFGPPSVRFGSNNRRYAKTLAYTDGSQDLVCLHFAALHDWNAPQPQPESPPVLIAAQVGEGPFLDSFTFTPAGAAYRLAPES